jgi:hypothetical protein
MSSETGAVGARRPLPPRVTSTVCRPPLQGGQLTQYAVIGLVKNGGNEGIEPFRFVPFDSFLYAVDILGYSFMSVATLLAARVFAGDGLERVARWFLTMNGLLVPFLVFQMYVHPLIWVASLWAVTFPGSTWTLALLFRRAT